MIKNGTDLFKAACEGLKNELHCDFAGLAVQNAEDPDVKWLYAAGNRNEKYRIITVRFGKGIAGKVISSGSPILVSHFPHEITGKISDYPIMLAEQLVSAYALPLTVNSVPKGVLLIGFRSQHTFTEGEKKLLKEKVIKVEAALPQHLKAGGQCNDGSA